MSFSYLYRAGADSLASQINYMKMRDFLNDQEITVLEEKEVSPPQNSKEKQNNPGFDQSRMRPKDIAHYINTQFKMPADSNTTNTTQVTNPIHNSGVTNPTQQQQQQNMIKRRPINVLPSQQSPLDPRNTQHPQQFWDKNSGFTYTGMFSSDC